MHTMPVIAIATTDTMQIGPGTFRTPLERPVVDEFSGYRVVSVTLGLGAKRANHLRVAEVAAFADVDISSLEA